METLGVKETVCRFCWSERDSDDASTPTDWRWIAVILASLFLNFSFFERHGLDVAGFGPLAVDGGVFCIAAVLVTVLFFIGPASQSMKLSVPF